jgi:hypothetical protein
MTSAAAVGHKMGAFMHDVTENYIGGSDMSTWNVRAESQWVDSRAPKVTQLPFIPVPFTEIDINQYCETRGWDVNNTRKRNQARENLRKQQKDEWRRTSAGDAVHPSTLASDKKGEFSLRKYFCRRSCHLQHLRYCSLLLQRMSTLSGHLAPRMSILNDEAADSFN